MVGVVASRSTKPAQKRRDWVAARRRYVSDPAVTLDDIAEDLGVTPGRVRHRAGEEGWRALRKSAHAAAIDEAREAVAQEETEFAIGHSRARRALIATAMEKLADRIHSGSHEVTPSDVAALSRDHREWVTSGAAPKPKDTADGEMVLLPRALSDDEKKLLETLNSQKSNGQSNGATSAALPYTPRNGEASNGH